MPPEPARWRRWFRFNLRTLMLFMLVFGLVLAVLNRPVLDPRELVGELVFHEKVHDVLDAPGGNSPAMVRDGLFLIRDRDGRTWCRGHFQQGKAIGRWTYYYENGREAWSGPSRDGVRTGVWNARDNAGRPLAEVRHAVPLEVSTGKGIFRHARRFGPVQYGLPGAPRWTGEFRHDQPVGTWTFWNAGGVRQTTDYVAGRPVGERSEWLARRLADLDSSDEWQRRRAVRDLSRLETEAAPHLLAALRSRHADVQRLAIESLLRLEARPAELLAKLEPLSESADDEVRFAALIAAVVCDEKQRKTRFARLLTFLDEKLDVQHTHWLTGVAQLGSLAVPYLDDGLNDRRANVRLICICVLGEIHTEDAETAFVFASQHNDPAVVRHVTSKNRQPTP